MSKLGLLLMLAFLTFGMVFAGCIAEYDANEAGAGASTGGANATGGAGSSKGGSGASGAATSGDGDGGGCSFSPGGARGAALSVVALSLGLVLAARRRARATR